jgi:hypothetical protein
MSKITRIDVRVQTGNRTDAGTNGDVFIAIAGREFKLDSAVDDFEKGSDRTYILGEGTGGGSPLNNPKNNDPATPFALDTADLDKFPIWIRFEPLGSNNAAWNLEFVRATVNPGPKQEQYQALLTEGNLWLGQNSGKYCFLKHV